MKSNKLKKTKAYNIILGVGYSSYHMLCFLMYISFAYKERNIQKGKNHKRIKNKNKNKNKNKK